MNDETTDLDAAVAAAADEAADATAAPRARSGEAAEPLPSALKTFAPLAALALAACGGGGGGEPTVQAEAASGALMVTDLPGSGGVQPAAPASPHGKVDAARFLTQATFGARNLAEIEDLRAKGFDVWLWEQFNAPVMQHVSYLDRMHVAFPEKKDYTPEGWAYEAIWQQWLAPEGQLRARVAFALSQIFVISNIAPDIRTYAMSSYWDLLNRHAFGNYRDLLEAVTLHPAMGYYLNMLRNKKGDPKKGTHPNENYAREVLQLFSIGLFQLNQDGSRVMSGGKPVPTYDESVIKGFAAAFTGWSFGAEGGAKEMFWKAKFHSDANWVVPMIAFPDYHETAAKKLLSYTGLDGNPVEGRIAEGGTPDADLQAALDNIFNHPNVAPFICRQLIQRLVTSNPTAGYIQRVAAVFNDNGDGVRGDLRAVVRAILLDAEARGDDAATRPRYGKLREPVIRFANFLRGLGARSTSGLNSIHDLDSADNGLGQSPLLAPSVFNFFSPNYMHAGPLADAGMFAPEFQITTEVSVVGSLNFMKGVLSTPGYRSGPEDRWLRIDYTDLGNMLATPEIFLERMNLLFFAGQMSAATRSVLQTLISETATSAAKNRVRDILMVIALAPDFAVQK